MTVYQDLIAKCVIAIAEIDHDLREWEYEVMPYDPAVKDLRRTDGVGSL